MEAARQTAGQCFVTEVVRCLEITPDTPRFRPPLHDPDGRLVETIREIDDLVGDSAAVPFEVCEVDVDALAAAAPAVDLLVECLGELPLDERQAAYLETLTPHEFVVMVGEMLDGGVSDVVSGQRWLADKATDHITAWEACKRDPVRF